MNNPKLEKIKLIFIPFLLIAIGFISVYTFLNWLLFIKFSVLDVKEDLVQFWLPFTLPYIPVIVWLRKRVKLLKFKNKVRDPIFGYLMLAGIAISIPTIITQQYLADFTGKMTIIKSIDEIDKHPVTKFYSLQSCYVNKRERKVQYSADVSGKYNESLNLNIYIASPIYNIKDEPTEIGTINNDTARHFTGKHPLIILDGNVIDSFELAQINPKGIATIKVLKGMAAVSIYGEKAINGVTILTSRKLENIASELPVQQTFVQPKAWLCSDYYKTISNHLDQVKKLDAENEFANDTYAKYDTLNLNAFVYLERLANNSAREGFFAAIKKADPSINNTSKIFMLKPKFESFDKRTGTEFPWIFGSFAIGAFVWFLIIFFTKLDDEKTQIFLSGGESAEKKVDVSFFKMFIPKEKFFVTPIIIDLNLLVFIIMIFAGYGFINFDADNLLKVGANFRPYTTNGQWWRLITSMFLHGGLMHVLSNMFALLFIGILLEPKLGKKRFTIFYFVTGILSSITSIWWYANTISVGASGAIFGMYGIFIALLLLKVFPKETVKATLLFMFIFIVYNLIIGLEGGVDNAAHIGGLISGFVIGLLIAPSLKVESPETENE